MAGRSSQGGVERGGLGRGRQPRDGQAGLGPELDRKRIELLKEVVPSLSRATVLANPTNPMTPQRLTEIRATAQALKVELHPVTVSDAKELDRALPVMTRARPAALIVFED